MRTRPVIQRHHNRYIGEYAPAWKTMEFMTFGNLEALYGSLLSDTDKRLISNHFNEPAVQTFKSYLSAIREVRNTFFEKFFVYQENSPYLCSQERIVFARCPDALASTLKKITASSDGMPLSELVFCILCLKLFWLILTQTVRFSGEKPSENQLPIFPK